jgi:hypothetical protein
MTAIEMIIGIYVLRRELNSSSTSREYSTRTAVRTVKIAGTWDLSAGPLN